MGNKLSDELMEQILSMPIEFLHLTVRPRNCLDYAGIETVGDLAFTTEDELLGIPNFGKRSIQEVKEILEVWGGLSLGMKSPFHDMPDAEKTPEVCLEAVKQKGWMLKYVPEANKTREVCLAAVEKNQLLLEYVPEALKTPEFYLAAVKQNSLVFESVPDELKTPEMCMMAVTQDGGILIHVPENLRTPELYLTAVQAEQKSSCAFWMVPEALRTPELCIAAVPKFGLALKYVPESMRTPELCLAAVRNFGPALEFVPEALKTREVCLAALEHDEGYERDDLITPALAFVPDAFKTADMCLAEVRKRGQALQYVPERFITRKLCLAVVEAGITGVHWSYGIYSTLRYVPEKMRTLDVCIAAMKMDERNMSDSFSDIPESVKRKLLFWLKTAPSDGETEPDAAEMATPGKAWLCAVRANGVALKYVPDALKTPDMCLAAVKAPARYCYGIEAVLSYVPEALRTPDLCMAAVQNEGVSLEFVPKNLKTAELCMIAVTHGDKGWIRPSLAYVPKALKTEELCAAAVNYNDDALKYVPKGLSDWWETKKWLERN
jgi:hypothetical protein